MVQYVVTLNATHAGFVNGNNTFYLEEQMKNAVESWVTPYKKPVLRHHDRHSDPIGHVIEAKYISTADANGMNAPKGHIQLKAIVSDMESVQKIKDGRYNTVSVSADAGYARCSVCDHKISEDGLCEHVRGKMYDGQKCFWYIGGLKYKEVSYVTAPADEFAETVQIEEKETDGMQIESVKDSEPKENVIKLTKTDDNASARVMFTFVDEAVKANEVNDEVDEWKNCTEDDLNMAAWLTVELQNECSDAILTAEKRKELKGDVFCGPNRTFPVNHSSHYDAAKRLLSLYKGPGNKPKMFACIEKRGKALGCSETKQIAKEETMADFKLEDALQEQSLKDHISSEVAKATKEANAKLKAFEALDEKVTKLEGDVATKDQEIKSLTDNVSKLEQDNESLRADIHTNLVDKVYDLRKGLQKKDVQDLKDDAEVEVYKTDLAKRSDDSLKDAVSDLLKEEPLAPVKKEIADSKGDGGKVKTEDSTDKDKESRTDQVKNFFFADEDEETK